MTRDVLITISKQELEKLRADEMSVIATHFRTDDHVEVAQKLVDEAEEMWGGDHASIPTDEWPNAHLQLVLGFYRDGEREVLLDWFASLEEVAEAAELDCRWTRSRLRRRRHRNLEAETGDNENE